MRERVPIDDANTVVFLCAAGMAEGDPDAALALFHRAWDSRSDDFEASVAAHFIARVQNSAPDRLHWNQLAVLHARNIADDRAASLFPSLYLNLADSLLHVAQISEARDAIETAAAYHEGLSRDGYSEFIGMGIKRLAARLSFTH
jgi:hypothetical protein